MSDSSSVLIQEIRKHGIPAFWMDTKKMQNAYSLEVKGSLISEIFFTLDFSSKNVQKSLTLTFKPKLKS